MQIIAVALFIVIYALFVLGATAAVLVGAGLFALGRWWWRRHKVMA